jgi:hypothetical protein
MLLKLGIEAGFYPNICLLQSDTTCAFSVD